MSVLMSDEQDPPKTMEIDLFGEKIQARVVDLDKQKYVPRWYEGFCVRIPYWFRCHVYLMTWRYGLQFDVQRDCRPDGSFRGNLWNWDIRFPRRLVKA